MAANSIVYTAHKNVCSLGARSARASVSDVQVAQGAIAPHKEPVATLEIGLESSRASKVMHSKT